MRIRGLKAAETHATAAFESEALSYLDSLYRTSMRLTRNPADAEDLVQETYLKAFRAADRFEPGTNLRAWLFTILHNTARNRARDHARDSVTIDSETVERAADTLSGFNAGAGPVEYQTGLDKLLNEDVHLVVAAGMRAHRRIAAMVRRRKMRPIERYMKPTCASR